MYPIKRENDEYLRSHNIRISNLNQPTMSGPPHNAGQKPKIRMLRSGRPASTIRITNVTTIKPPDPELVKKLEEENLRAQLQMEIVSRSRACAHRGYDCVQPVLAGRAYCSRHALADPSAPYTQCSQVFANGLRCSMLAPVDRGDGRDLGLCFEHARVAMINRQRSAAPPPPVTTTETLLNQLQHYIRPERTRTTSCASSVSVVSDPADQDPPNTSIVPVDPFKEINACTVNAAASTAVMECASDTDSDADVVTLGPGGDSRAVCDHEPECDEAPVERAPLWCAGVLTAEEAVGCARAALRWLRAGYRRQAERLRVLLRMERARYLKALRAEKDVNCSIHTQATSGPLTVRERRQLQKLKAYAGYHRKHGVEAVLARKLYRKRAKVNDFGPHRPVPPQARCTFTEGGVRCDNQSLPAAKHCMKHILLDKHQVLFHPCGDTRGCVECREPVARLPLPSQRCRYHSGAPPYHPPPMKDPTETETHSNTDESQIHGGASTVQSPMVEEHVELESIPDLTDHLPLEPLEFA